MRIISESDLAWVVGQVVPADWAWRVLEWLEFC